MSDGLSLARGQKEAQHGREKPENTCNTKVAKAQRTHPNEPPTATARLLHEDGADESRTFGRALCLTKRVCGARPNGSAMRTKGRGANCPEEMGGGRHSQSGTNCAEGSASTS